ncbi:Rus Holliday junction resolvase [uncultured Caudovirales phage]|jgi:Holliday junction resolvase RusA-like endonuclease|uniref:Rus Holliday junction resolvase n=1 Tax=uncultured Caudovirales phage TaxID=2100421 RepID=A0A6J5NB60_9CAUD|nr:Rus Holliday junction resolvase [uncultured Caudovirales phage]
MAEVSLSVTGDPASQGSHAIMHGRIVQVNSSKHKAWRKAIVQEAIATLPLDWQPIDEPCELIVAFYLPKPKTVTRQLPSVSPDLDKLIRAVGDSLTDSGVVADDSRIVRISARKLYAEGIQPGATILVKTLN